MTDEEKIVAANLRWMDAFHSIPRSVRYEPVTALANHRALVNLLLNKGVFTVLEYTEALAKAMEDEKFFYENYLEAFHSEPVPR